MKMKPLFKSAIIISLVFICAVNLTAQVERKKEIKKTFNVSERSTLTITNKFGDVHINSWDKNVIDVKVTITAKKRSESKAQEALESVRIDFEESSSGVEIETFIRGGMNNRNGEKLTIDYIINMPETNDLNAKNSYGTLYVDDISGKVFLKMAYGEIKVGELKGEAEIKLSYGNGEVDKMRNGELYAGYSNLTIEEMGDVEITSQYSNLDIQKSKDISISNKYGNLMVNEIQSLKGSSKYGKVAIRRLYNTLVLDIAHGSGVKVQWISKDFNWIDIDSSYSSSSLMFEKGFYAELEGNFRYCDLKYDKDEFDFSYINKGNTSNEYKGRIGSGRGNAKIKLRSDYGNIRIGYSSL